MGSQELGLLWSAPSPAKSNVDGMDRKTIRAGRAVAASYILRRVTKTDISDCMKKADASSLAERPVSAQDVISRGMLRAPERLFLHQALLGVGANVNKTGGREDAHPANFHDTFRGFTRGRPSSARHIEALRHNHELHLKSINMELSDLVERKSQEVDTLKATLAQMQDKLRVTRHAILKRRWRTGHSTFNLDHAKDPTKEALDTQGIKTKETQTDSGERDIGSYVAEFDSLKTELENQQHIHDKLMVRRKYIEATLFTCTMESLRFRNLALKQEARSGRLAKELRRLYRELPNEMNVRLSNGLIDKEKLKSDKLQKMCVMSKPHLYKFMTLEKQAEERLHLDQIVGKIQACIDFGEDVLDQLSAHDMDPLLVNFEKAFLSIRKCFEYFDSQSHRSLSAQAKVKNHVADTFTILEEIQSPLLMLKSKMAALGQAPPLITSNSIADSLSLETWREGFTEWKGSREASH